MKKGRLEAFSDGVFAIIITIMVLELKAPDTAALEGIRHLLPEFVSYALSFIYVGIYWNNHHHMIHAAEKVNGGILWANLHLLFWLSLVPFTTAWVGKTGLQTWPVAAYGVVLLLAGTAYYVLAHSLAFHHGKGSALERGLGDDFKGKVSVAVYAVGICVAGLSPKLAYALYVAVAVMWICPDPRFERA